MMPFTPEYGNSDHIRGCANGRYIAAEAGTDEQTEHKQVGGNPKILRYNLRDRKHCSDIGNVVHECRYEDGKPDKKTEDHESVVPEKFLHEHGNIIHETGLREAPHKDKNGSKENSSIEIELSEHFLATAAPDPAEPGYTTDTEHHADNAAEE
jgi:hypothetical protein